MMPSREKPSLEQKLSFIKNYSSAVQNTELVGKVTKT